MGKQYIKYEVDGETVYVEAESISSEINEDISHNDDSLIEGGKFETAIESIKPVANAVLGVLKELNDPSEVALEMGIKLGAKTGVILASVDSEATLKITVKWHRKT